jgi:hypothetical protein
MEPVSSWRPYSDPAARLGGKHLASQDVAPLVGCVTAASAAEERLDLVAGGEGGGGGGMREPRGGEVPGTEGGAPW